MVRALVEFVLSTEAMWDQGCYVEDDFDLCVNVRFLVELSIAVEVQQDAIIRVSSAGKDWKVMTAQTVVFLCETSSVEGSKLLMLAERCTQK